MDDEARRKLALWRFGVLGPLVSARLEHGDRRAYFREAAERRHERPDGKLVRLSARTIEDWFYAWLGGGFDALLPESRSDRGQSRAVSSELGDLILRAKREKPRRSVRRIIRMLERAGRVRPGELSRSSVHRLLRAHGVSQRPLRGAGAERRSFIVEHAGDLWVGDAMHGPRVLVSGSGEHKSYLLSQIDCATRYAVHSYFALSEGAVEQEHGFKQALWKGGRPRSYYVDRGSAYIADSLRFICAELDIRLLHTDRGDCEAKGVIERWHETWRAEVGDEIDGRVLSLDELNSIHWAWLGAEYHAREHDTTKRAPREHWLAEASELRALPRNKSLDDVFLHRESRVVRKDGTVRFAGALLEVRAELVGQKVELRFDPTDEHALPRVFQNDRFVCDTVPLDRIANSMRRRRQLVQSFEPPAVPSGIDPIALIERDHYQRTRLPPGALADATDPDDLDE